MKKMKYSDDEIILADISKALSHPARIKILKILSNTKGCLCGDIVDLLPLAQSTVSQHLKELKRVGLITGEYESPKICYCLNDNVIKNLLIRLNYFIDNLNNKEILKCKTDRKLKK